MAYFDTTDPTHLALLPVQLRDYDDLANVAAVAEADVIELFSVSNYNLPFMFVDAEWVQIDTYDYVALRGYKVDASQASAAFADKMRREIANLIRWKKAQASVHPMLSVEFKSGMSTSIRDNSNNLRPPSFGQQLKRYDLRPVIHSI